MLNKLSLVLFFIVFTTVSVEAQMPAQTADILIKNAKILDGTGNSWFYGDIAVSGGKILQIGKLKLLQMIFLNLFSKKLEQVYITALHFGT